MSVEREKKWDYRFLELADHVSQWSKDPSTKVGAVVVDPYNRILGMGYNGLPMHVKDEDIRYNDRNLKYKMIVHAEANAILHSNFDLTGSSLYCTHMCCSNCTGLIIQSGISTVVCYAPDKQFYDRYKESINISEVMMKEASIGLWLYEKNK